MQKPTIKTILFDADGVIQNTPKSWQPELQALCKSAENKGKFLADIFEAEKPCLTGSADFVKRLATVLNKWGCDVSLQQVLGFWNQLETDHEMLDLIKQLRSSGMQVALVTNQNSYRAAFMANDLGYNNIFDHTFFSCDMGYVKPSHQYFQSILHVLQVKPQQVLFIDDSEPNVMSARDVGLFAEVFDKDKGFSQMGRLLAGYGF